MAHDNPGVSDLYVVGTDTPADGYFDITFDFDIDPATVIVQVQEPGDDTWTTLTKGTDYNLDTGGSRISFITSTYEPPTDTYVYISRSTSLEREVSWRAGTTYTAAEANLDENQEFYLLQELFANLGRSLQLDITGSYWDAEGLRIANGADAVDNTDFATLEQVIALVNNAEVANLSQAVVWDFTGDDDTTDFELTGLSQTTLERQLIVTINGVLQHTGAEGSAEEDLYYTLLTENESDYPSGATNPWIRFTDPPAGGDAIEVRVFQGTVLTQIGQDVFDGTAIQDGSIGLEHFGFDSGDDDRFLLIDSSGDATLGQIDPSSLAGDYTAGSATDGFNEAVRESRLDQMAAPTANVSMNGKKLTSVGAPTSSGDAANKAYVDGKTPLTSIDSGVASGSPLISGETDVQIATVSYCPDKIECEVTWNISDGTVQESYVFLPLGTQKLWTAHAGGYGGVGSQTHTGSVEITTVSNGFKMRIAAAYDSPGTIARVAWVTYKF